MNSFEIIRFTADSQWYHPKSIKLGILADAKSYIDHTQIEIPVGASRIGRPIIDYPVGEKIPKKSYFAAMLKLSEFSRFDPLGLLPKKGYLYFFISGYGDKGSVQYFDIDEDDLERRVIEHEKWFWDGCLIDCVYNDTEYFKSRYVEEGGNVEWDYFAGSDISKIYGIYTHCQKDEKEIKKIANSSRILLLQIGEDFTGEGVWSVLISKSDLKKMQFGKCTFSWGQS